MFIAALFAVAQTGRRQCLLTDEWIKKMWYIYTMEYYPAIKRIKFWNLQQHEYLESIMLSKISQTKTNIVCHHM